MHPAVLDATGYTLLLSSFVTLAILLQKRCKYEQKSSFFILSMSDVFSAILTAIVLLVSHVEAGIKLSYNWRNDTGDTANRTWIRESEDKQRFPFMQIRDFREIIEETDPDNLTLMCDTKNLITQYGMLLAPLTNAFISLLTFVIQCNLNAIRMKRRCTGVTTSPSNDPIQFEPKCIKVTCQRRGTLRDKQESMFQQDNVNAARTSGDVLRRLRISRFQTLQGDNRKLASIFVMSHWIVPFLVIVILHFAEYSDMGIIQHEEDSECIFESNFPVNDFYISPNKEDSSKILPFSAYKTPLEDYYFINEGLSNKSNLNSTELNRIVSKVQSIIRIMLGQRNFTLDTEAINPFNGSRLQNATEYLLTDVTNIKYIGNRTDKIIQGTNYTITEQNEASEESNITTIRSLSDMMQISAEDKDRGNTEIYLANTEENVTQRTTNIPILHVTPLSNNQIYINLMKRIQATSVHTAVKGHHNRSVLNEYRNKQQLRQNDSTERITSTKSNSIENLFLNKNDHSNFYTNIETKNDSFYMINNKCLLSNKFLKLHLFALTIIIYFLPILFCCVLQTRGKYICENTLATLKATTDFISTSLSSERNITANEHQSEECSSSGKKIYQQDSNEKSNASQEITDIHSHETTDIEVTNKNYMEVQSKGMFSEIDCTMKIFRTIKMSLILCTILWTPIFLGTLLRVFSCVRAPRWLTDTMFLGAISYSIVRNYLNISIVKIQELYGNDNAKENRVHPAE